MTASANDPGNPRRWEARVSEAASRIEGELRNLVRTFDEDVVPEIRKHGSAAMRSLAAKLDRAAAKMEEDDRARAAAPPPPPRP